MTANESARQLDFDIVPAHLAVNAMRDSGYRNAAYAIAELMDNAIQARATSVELLCQEVEIPILQRVRSRIHRIGVLDNGTGMDADVLRMALQFGNGTHLDDRSGMGRFGMGLPNASISQCKRVDVWTWQDGLDSAIHTYIDVDEIAAGRQREVPEPRAGQVPEFWKNAGRVFGASGTLVVWSSIDRCIWKTARSIIQNSEFLIGRMYRRFLNDGRVVIRLASFTDDNSGGPTIDRDAVLTDPLYLCVPSSCPEPYKDEPMFQPFGDPIVMQVEVPGGGVHEVVLKFSYALEEARRKPQAGQTKYGKHAGRNIGVSVVRAGRELELEEAWTISYDPRERWWGAEIEFPAELDEVFGVANNKQSARNLADAARLDFEEFLDGRTVAELKEELAEDEDPMGPLLDIAQRIQETLQQIRRLIKAQGENERAGRQRRHEEPESAEAVATSATEDRKQAGQFGVSDADEALPDDDRMRDLASELENTGLSRGEADALAASTVDLGLKYVFTQGPLESSAFFSVRPKAGTIIITLNTEHPAYGHLIEVLENDTTDADSVADLQERLDGAAKGLRLLLAAWARFEDEAVTQGKQALQDNRADWGRVARQFLS